MRVRDNSSPQLLASKSKNIGHVYCLQGSNETSTRSSNNNVKIAYPNPATTFLYYSFEANPIIQIFDNSGRNIKCNYEQINDQEILINISNLAKGVYYISELDNTKSKIKFIKI